jgi:hypothetical protein
MTNLEDQSEEGYDGLSAVVNRPEEVEEGRVADGSKIKGKDGSEKKCDTGIWKLNTGKIVEFPVKMPLKYAIGALARRTNEAAEKGEIPKNSTYPIVIGDTIDPYIVGRDEDHYKFPFLIYEQASLMLAKLLIHPGMEGLVGKRYDLTLRRYVDNESLPETVGDLAGIPKHEQTNGKTIPLQIVHHFEGNPYESPAAKETEETTEEIDPEWAEFCAGISEGEEVLSRIVGGRPTGVLRKGFEEPQNYDAQKDTESKPSCIRKSARIARFKL